MFYPRVIAHRCGGGLAPENTLSGLLIAARIGCRGVEFDAMLDADGVPVLMHDETLERTTSGCGPVGEARHDELARLDAGIRHHHAFSGEPIPTLKQALNACAELGLWANVEIKPSAGREAETGREVARLASGFDRILLSSFSSVSLNEAALAAARLPRALLIESLDDWRLAVSEVVVQAVHVAAKSATLAGLQPLHAAGISVACYTVNDRDVAQRLFSMGVRAIFTDRPDRWPASEM